MTYKLVITTVSNKNGHKNSATWSKHLMQPIAIPFTSVLYILLDYDVKKY